MSVTWIVAYKSMGLLRVPVVLHVKGFLINDLLKIFFNMYINLLDTWMNGLKTARAQATRSFFGQIQRSWMPLPVQLQVGSDH